jgi:catechol 2,3-dioxygenase-like lactoylglutathione lyase family enzyme
MKPPVTGILEASLYVDDVAHSAEFYHDLFGFEVLTANNRMAALSVVDRDALLLFKKGATTQPIPMEDGFIPPHDADGHIHVAFSVPADSLPEWEARLAERGVPVQSRHRWPRGGTSVYFRDPDGHLVEVVTPGCLSIY